MRAMRFVGTLGIALAMLATSLAAPETAIEPVPARDPLTEHLATGFPLEGAHQLIARRHNKAGLLLI